MCVRGPMRVGMPMCVRGPMRMGMCVRARVRKKYLFVIKKVPIHIKIIKKLSCPLEATSRKWVADSPHIAIRNW